MRLMRRRSSRVVIIAEPGLIDEADAVPIISSRRCRIAVNRRQHPPIDHVACYI
jgi:hypothetical protein